MNPLVPYLFFACWYAIWLTGQYFIDRYYHKRILEIKDAYIDTLEQRADDYFDQYLKARYPGAKSLT